MGAHFFSMDDGTDKQYGTRTKRFKAEAGRKYRLSFAWWYKTDDGKPDLNKAPRFVGNMISYIEGVGFVVADNPEIAKLAGKAPSKRIATVIISWPVDRTGKLDMSRVKSDAEVFPWVIPEDKYDQIRDIHREFPLGKHDINVSCTDTSYQKMSFVGCKESVLEKLLASGDKGMEIVGELLEKADTIAENIEEELARKMTFEAIREKLAGGGPVNTMKGSSPSAAASDIDIDSLMDGVLE